MCRLSADEFSGRKDMTRMLAGTVIIDGMDDETFGSNEFGHSVQTIQMFLDAGQPANSLRIKPLRFGGEVRIEADVTAHVVNNSAIQVAGVGKLYEGDSENTDDLDDQENITFTVPKGKSATFASQLRNSGAGGGDTGTITFFLTNTIVE
jgi:hypothetical protein